MKAPRHEKCPHCDRPGSLEASCRPYKRRAANGLRVVVRCQKCRRAPDERRYWRVTADYLNAALLPTDPLETPGEPCDVCAAVAPLERHHFAPTSLFDDADRWPVADLCGPCHRRWHDVTGIACGTRPTISCDARPEAT